jgi:hypothetical protein
MSASASGDELRQSLAQRVREVFRGFALREEAKADLGATHDDDEQEAVRLVLGGKHWSEVDLSELHAHYPCAFLVSKAVFTSYLPAYILKALTADPRGDFEDAMPEWLIEPGAAGQPPRAKFYLDWLSETQRALVADLLEFWGGPEPRDDDVEYWSGCFVDECERRRKRLCAAADMIREYRP